MKSHLRYLSYVFRHKCFVFWAGLKTGAPLWRLVIHDYSKFSKAEWTPYVNRFMRGNSGRLDKENDPEEFHRAWTHHWHKNPHHWEYWLRLKDAELVPMRMPENFVREMVADWMGAGRAITGRWEVHEWYAQASGRMLLHTDTRALVEKLL